MSDVVIVIPKLDELEAMSWAFGTNSYFGPTSGTTAQGFSTYHENIHGIDVCFVSMDAQDTLNAGLATLGALIEETPSHAILVGTALGQSGKTTVGSVVVSTAVQYLVELVAGSDVAFRNPTRVESKSEFSKLARATAVSKFWPDSYRNALHDACNTLLGQRIDPNDFIETHHPRVHAEVIASSNVYFQDGATEAAGTTAEKMLFSKQYGAKAYDMESAGFARAAQSLGVEWLVVRGISDYGQKINDDTRTVAAAVAGRCALYLMQTLCNPAAPSS